MNPIRAQLSRLSIVDGVNLVFLGIVAVLFATAYGRVPDKAALISAYGTLFLLVNALAYLRDRTGDFKMKELVMLVYPILFLFGLFETFYLLIPYFNSNRYDLLMTKIDLALLGCYPTVWIERFSSPVLTEFMYLLYIFYFPMPLIVVGWLYRKRMFQQIQEAFMVFFLCYYTAYFVYFFIPVEGPRFFIAALHTVRLDGLFLADKIRDFIDFFEPNKLDCFPSLHSAILSVTMLVCYRHNKPMFWLFQPVAVGIMVSLVYCRYHYVVDIIAGLLLAVPAFFGGIYLNKTTSKYFRFHFKTATT